MKRSAWMCALALTALAPAILTGCAHNAAEAQSTPAPMRVRTQVVRVGVVRPVAVIPGLIAPHRTVALSSSMTEPATSVYVHDGQHVVKGQVLAVLATDDLRAALTSALRTAAVDRAKAAQVAYQARYAFAQGGGTLRTEKANVAAAQATLHEDELNGDRYTTLAAKGYVSQQQLDAQRTRIMSDEQSLRAAQAALQTAMAKVSVNGTQSQGLQASNIAAAQAQAQAGAAQAAEIRHQIARATIRSPINGIVVNRNLNPGEYPGGRQIFTLQATAHVYAVLNANSRQASEIRPGATAQITRTGGFQQHRYAGTVTAVLPQTSPGSTNFAIKVDVPNPAGRLEAGMPVVATVALTARHGVVVPTTAFLDDRDSSVMVAAGHVAQKRRVRELASNGAESAVSGLANGSRIIVNGGLGLRTGQRISFER